MKTLRSSGLIGITLLLTVLLAACGETAMQGTPANTANQSMNNQNAMNNKTDSGMMYGTPTATSNINSNGNMMDGIPITPSMGGSMAAFIHTGIATINGNRVNVLMTNKGFAVYYYRADTMFKATCTGQCAHDWPPVLAPQGRLTVSSSMPLLSMLSIQHTHIGAQYLYDCHEL